MRRVTPARQYASWYSLGDFALKDSDAAAFRDARNRDAKVQGIVEHAKATTVRLTIRKIKNIFQ